MTSQAREIDHWRDAFAIAAADRPHVAEFTTTWPIAYQAYADAERAVADAETLATLGVGKVAVGIAKAEAHTRVSVYTAGSSIPLGEMLPALQAVGLDIMTEQPFTLARRDGTDCWIYDFSCTAPPGALDSLAARDRLSDALLAAWNGRTEVDTFTRLVTVAGMDWRDVALMRAYGQYLHQLGVAWDRSYAGICLSSYATIATQLLGVFRSRFHPDIDLPRSERDIRTADAAASVTAAIDSVASLVDDQVLRAYLSLVMSTVRTNVYDSGSADEQRAIALKFAPDELALAPHPRPRFEVWVSSPRVEGVHIRFGSVARGGLRWSDRREDLRTEVLGLATAQVAKNAVIVPTGAKGGFVLKEQPGTSLTPLAGYQEFVSALLDVHDNLDPATLQPVPPETTVAYDGGDAYLVVAADKGTANFSDAANAIAVARDYWLGDAFASGGSVGYDHKALGITARGAWCSVERHFDELGMNPAEDEFTVAGIGDMSGDVFGNGMLLSSKIRLVAAFDHRNIFLDPLPEPARSFRERQRLAAQPHSSWDDYDRTVISEGGGVHARSAKSVPISRQVAEALGIAPGTTALTPDALIQAILTAPVDLLWNGGIGTYVRASSETDRDASDKVNDAVRVPANEVRARVIGEGGNLGLTQRARIEYAQLGGRINTDAIDNSAGVGCSDREVNIKIALAHLARSHEFDRGELLASMADDVCDLVLAENVAQNHLLGQARHRAVSDLPLHGRVIASLEGSLGIDRGLLALPNEEEIDERIRQGRGLTSPELCVLAALVKRDLRAAIVADSLSDDPALAELLIAYFPAQLHSYAADLTAHPLRREIVATELTNLVVDLAGLGFVHRMREYTNATASDVVRAFLAVTQVFDLRRIWEVVRSSPIATDDTERLVRESLRLVDAGTRWLLRNRPQPLDLTAEVKRFGSAIEHLSASLPSLLTEMDEADIERRLAAVGEAHRLAPAITREVFELLDRYCFLDIIDVTQATDAPLQQVAETYFLLKDRRSVNALLADVNNLPRPDQWSGLAVLGLHDDLYEAVRAICASIVLAADGRTAEELVGDWEQAVGQRLSGVQVVVDASRSTGDLVHLMVAARSIRALASAGPVV